MARSIPNHIIDEIRNRTSIVDVISSRVPLKQSGSAFKACCPFHKEKTPSFTVNPSRESFKCFGCGEGGDVFSFLMKHDGMTFMDAVEMLADRCGVKLEFGDDGGAASTAKRLLALHTEVAEFYRRCLLQMKGAEGARKYLKSRALMDDIVERFKIGYAPETPGTLEKFASAHKYTIEEIAAAGLGAPLDNPRPGRNLHDRFRGRLMFPICDTQGRVIAFSGRVLDSAKSPAKYVNSPETDIFKKSRVLYALDKAQRKIVAAPHREAIICEGQIDVIRCHACGFDRAVASQGTAFTEEHAKLLKRYADSAVLVFDQDPAGQKAAVRTGAVLLAAGIPVRVAHMPEGEDPDSFLRSNPPEAFQKVLDEAVGLVPFHVAYLRAQESSPDSEGAAGRIAAGVLQTIAICRNEVHKARMLQETAELMRIPEEALQSELNGIEEVLKRQQETAGRRAEVRGGGVTAAATRGALPMRDDIPFEEPMTYVDDEVAAGGIGFAGAGATKNGIAADLPDRVDVSVCELLVHTFYDDKQVVTLMAELLPSWLVKGSVCRRAVAGFYDALRDGEDKLVELQEADEAVGEFIGSLAVAPNKTGGRENFTALDLAHDLILTQWRRRCKTRKAQLEPAAGSADSPEAARRRMELMLAERRLMRWEEGEATVRELAAKETEPETSSELTLQSKSPADETPSVEQASDAMDNPGEEPGIEYEQLMPEEEMESGVEYDDY